MWKRKKQENVEKTEFFLKIALTNQGKMNIYIGWPVDDDENITIEKLGFLLNGIINGGFSEQIIKTLEDFENPIINQAIKNIPNFGKDYISPMDVL